MRAILPGLLLPLLLLEEARAPSTANLAALARLYGVVRWFHPSDAAQEIDWDRFAVHGVRRVHAARGAAELRRALGELFAPVAVGVVVEPRLPAPPSAPRDGGPLVAWRHLGPGFGSRGGGSYASARTNRDGQVPFEAPLRAGQHVDFDLGAGLRARVPLVLAARQAAIGPAQAKRLAALRAELAGLPSAEPADPAVRAADVIVAWSALRHFYPYWTEAAVDWDARLVPLLEASRAAGSRAEHRDALRRLVVEFQDGHGRVSDPQAPPEKPLPIALRWLEGRLVVMATGAPDRVSVGDVILEVDGRPASAWMAEAEALQSGSPHHRAWRAVRALVRGPEGRRLSLELERGGERVRVELAHGGGRSPWSEPRPASIGEVRPGIWYVDLERARWAQVQPRLPELARAPAVVFDMRGYPSDAAAILGHLLKGPLQASWLHVPKIVEPFGRFLGWHDLTRSPPPALPRLEGKIVFLADARAVSAAESLLGDVAFQRLGTVVGGPTAGANGMAITFPLPSGMSVTFTGARVTRHDGRVFHLHGVPPTVPVVPTLEGIRAGRDEVLERALALAGADPSPD